MKVFVKTRRRHVMKRMVFEPGKGYILAEEVAVPLQTLGVLEIVGVLEESVGAVEAAPDKAVKAEGTIRKAPRRGRR